MSQKRTAPKAKAGLEQIIVTDFDDVCDDIANGPYTLDPNSRCTHLLRSIISEEDTSDKSDCFEALSTRINNHPARNRLISEIVGSWFHLHYLRMWQEITEHPGYKGIHFQRDE
jgi:hypothetical protein